MCETGEFIRCQPDSQSYSSSIHTFSTRPCSASFSLISLCFSALKMIKADLKRLGASGAFLYFGEPIDLACPMGGRFGSSSAMFAACWCCCFTNAKRREHDERQCNRIVASVTLSDNPLKERLTSWRDQQSNPAIPNTTTRDAVLSLSMAKEGKENNSAL